MAKFTPAERKKRRKRKENITSAKRNWETHFRPHILYLLRDARAGHYAAFILACCSAEQAYVAVKDHPIECEVSKMRPALKYALRHWAKNGGLKQEDQWHLAEEKINDDFMEFVNKVKHYWRLPEGFQLIHGLTEDFTWSRRIDSQVVGVTDDGWALRDPVPNSRKIVYNTLAICDMLIKGVDAIYHNALCELESS